MKVSIRNTIIVSLNWINWSNCGCLVWWQHLGTSNNNNNNGNGNGNGNDRSNEDYYQSVYRDRAYRRRHHKCPTQRLEHQVVMKKFSDSTGYWVLYTQIIETRTSPINATVTNTFTWRIVKEPAGFGIQSIILLVQYSLGEPKFIGRRVKHPSRPNVTILVNMSMNYAAQTVDLDRVFPNVWLNLSLYIGPDDMKWSEVARSSFQFFKWLTPILNLSSLKRIPVWKRLKF